MKIGEFSFISNNFTAGQVSPRIRRRSDLTKYQNGVKTLENMTIMPQGGVKSRPGSVYVAGVKDHTKKVRLEKFQFSTDDTYILEFGDQYLRFYKDNGQILESDLTITGITQANPAVVTTSGSHGLSNGDQVYITEVVGMTEINNTTQYYTVANVTATTFEVQDQDGTNVNSSAFTAYSSGGVVNRIYTLTTDWDEAELFELQFTQSADKMYITHQDYSPKELTRTADTSWTLTSWLKDGEDTGATLQVVDGPYLAENSTATTLTPSGTSGSITVTASAVTGINSDTGFQTTDVGRLIRFKDDGGSTWHYMEITARSSTTVVTATIIDTTLPNTNAVATWRLGAWSETTGFPAAVTFYQGRIAFGGTKDQPDSVWLSKTDDFTNFTPGTDDDDPISATFASNEVNSIIWMSSHKELRIGTTGGEHVLRSASTTTALTPTSVEQFQETSYGSKLRVKPVQVHNATIFPQRTGKKIRQFGYDFSVDSFLATDITVINEDVTKDGITQINHQREPDGIIWCVRSDGKLLGLTYLPEQEVAGWHIHSFGGTSVVVESVAAIPISGQDQVWVAIKRTIDGTTRRYVERLGNEFIRDEVKNAVFMDSAISVAENKPAATLTPSATTGTGITLTAGSSVFVSGDVGRFVQGNSGKALISGYTSGTEVTANVLEDFTDTSAIASGSWTLSQTAISGLDHLEGESVTILTDGGVHVNETVSAGAITLDYEATTIHVGLSYTQKLETLDIDFGSQRGTAFGNRGRLNKVILEVFETVGGKVGHDSTSTREVIYRQGNDTPNVGIPLFTGSKSLRFSSGWKDINKVYFEQTDPLPITLLGLTMVGEVSDSS